MRRVCRYTLSEDSMLSAKFVKLRRQVAAMAVKNEKPILTNTLVLGL